MIENPSDVPLLIQVLPLSLYPNPQTLVDLLSPSLAPDRSEYIEMDDTDIFILQDLEKYSVSFIHLFTSVKSYALALHCAEFEMNSISHFFVFPEEFLPDMYTLYLSIIKYSML